MAADTNYSPTPPILYIISMKCNPSRKVKNLKNMYLHSPHLFYVLTTDRPIMGPYTHY